MAAVACNSSHRMTDDVEHSYTNINTALPKCGVRGESPIEPDGTSNALTQSGDRGESPIEPDGINTALTQSGVRGESPIEPDSISKTS